MKNQQIKELSLQEMEGLMGGWPSWDCIGAGLMHVGALAAGATATVATSGVAVVGAIALITGSGMNVYSKCG
jgi:hypothetical protein